MKILHIIQEFGQLTSAHGIPNIMRANYFPMKIMWTIFFLLATSASFYISIKSIISFIDFEVVTKTIVNQQEPSEFQTVTICNQNLFTTLSDKPMFDENYSILKNKTLDD